jgi:hypothetical protein
MRSNNLPSGWDDQSIQGLTEHYDDQTDAEAAAEHVAALAVPATTHTKIPAQPSPLFQRVEEEPR